MAASGDVPLALPPAPSLYTFLGAAGSAVGVLASLLASVASLLLRAAGLLYAATAWTAVHVYSVAAWPVARLVGVLQVVLSPVTYTLSYALLPVQVVLRILARLRPLYVYLGSAAFIGIVTGLVLKLASSYMVGLLGLQSPAETADMGDDMDDDVATTSATARASRARRLLGHRPSSSGSSYSMAASAPPTPLSSTSTGTIIRRLPKIEESAGPPHDDLGRDDVWQWLEEFNDNPKAAADGSFGISTRNMNSRSSLSDAASLSHKPRPRGLLSLAILEESSSEDRL